MKDALASLHAPVAAEMAAVEALLREALETDLPDVGALRDHVAAFAGKRMRPTLVLLTGRALGRITEDHVRLAVVIEIIHAATLVHDDIIDEARIRRGTLSLNALRGNEISVLFGDFLYARAVNLLASFDDPGVIRGVSKAACLMCEGELLQVLTRNNPRLSREQYLRIIRRKTAALYGAGAALAALLSGAAPSVREALERFGEEVGTAFQIVDDCLDLVGDEAEVGKSLGTDLKKGKVTLPILRILEVAGEEDRRRVAAWIVARDGEAPRDQIQGLLRRYGAVAHAYDEADRLLASALSRLEALRGVADTADLGAFAEYSIRRNR